MRPSSSAAALLALVLLAVVPVMAAAQTPTSSAPPPATAAATAGIERRVESILGQMTIEEKIDLLGGVDFFCLRGVPRLGVPRLRMADGPMGVRNDGPATAFGGGIALAASWNPALVEKIGAEYGRDARAKGVHFLLAPGVNIYRSPLTARNFEYFGEDPFLAARIAVGFIKGVQSQGVSATVKHFAANNSEYDRNHTDSIVDERTLREIYLPAFEAAVKEAKVGAIMDAYNLTNGSYMSQNVHLNKAIAKGEWGFPGVIMSDWISTYDAVGAANGGLDFEMPSGEHLNREQLLPAIQAGQVSVATIDDKVRRILRVAATFGWLDREQQDLSIPRFNPQGRGAALLGAREGVVLLKNEGGLLPLEGGKVKSILLVGPTAYPAVTGAGGSSLVQPFVSVSLLEGLSALTGGKVRVLYARGLPSLPDLLNTTQLTTAAAGGAPGLSAEYFASDDLSGTPVITRVEPRIQVGTRDLPDFPAGTLSERWKGFYTAAAAGQYDFTVGTAGDRGGYFRLRVDDKTIIDDWSLSRAGVQTVAVTLEAGPHAILLEHHGRPKWPGSVLQLAISRQGERIDAVAKTLAKQVDAVVVAAGFDPTTEFEGSDRDFHLPPGQDELIQTMAGLNKNTIVVMTSGGAVDMKAWIDRVPALLQVWYPGQEGGTAAAEILLGLVNPSGRLPATFERRWEDNPVHDSHYPEPGTLRILYKEGVFVGYRGYDKAGVTPLFPFGFGLSYTTFHYSNLTVAPEQTKNGDVLVSFDLTNTGARAGAEVAQVYVSDTHSKVPRPRKELKGFAKVSLKPNETQRVTVMLDRRSLSYYDVTKKAWVATPGVFEILVGRSSAPSDIELRGKLTLTK